MEHKKLERKARFLFALVAGAFLILVLRLGFLQLVEVAKYQTQARQNHQRLIPIVAPRGDIIDRNGERIVGNRPVYTVSVTYLGLKNTQHIVDTLAQILKQEEKYAGMDVEQVKAVLQEKMQAKNLRLYEPVNIATGVSLETVARIEERRMDLPGVVIDVRPVRDYPYGDLLAPVLGYVGEIEKEQLEKNADKGYQLGDNFGKTGLENQYEMILKGESGARLVEVDAIGRPVRDLGVEAPLSGNSLMLTIDHRLQRVAQDALLKGIANARKRGEAKVSADKSLSAAAVVLDARTGEVLSMASVPSFNPVLFAKGILAHEYEKLTETGALRNHCIETTYIPGSTFKMVTATAVLEEKMINPEATIFCPGYYKTQRCWKPGGHGKVDLKRALKVSCDTFFYMFGAQAGPELIGKYAQEYGLGEKTGIDLPGEEAGRVPSREYKKEIWPHHSWESQWHEYDSTNMAIGQGDNKYTPLQLASYMAAIANGGQLYRPYMVKKIIGPDGEVVATYSPQLVRWVKVSPDVLKVIQEGLHTVTQPPDGTASGVFAGAPYRAAAKTGTAEVGDEAGNAHALFLAYAPFENPEIAVSVVIEYGGKGSDIAGPVAREIMDSYFSFQAAKSLNEEEVAPPSSPETPVTSGGQLPPPSRKPTPPAAEQGQELSLSPDQSSKEQIPAAPNLSKPPVSVEKTTGQPGQEKMEQGQKTTVKPPASEEEQKPLIPPSLPQGNN